MSGLMTDLYQLTMVYAMWKRGLAEQLATFDYFFRKLPFGGGYVVTCGQKFVGEFLAGFNFDESEVAFLRDQPQFAHARDDREFWKFLLSLRWSDRCELYAMRTGTLAFPREPILRMTAPYAFAQIVETRILNLMNFCSLAATKASRIRYAAGNAPVMEFGFRRAHGDAAMQASYAAWVGGVDATSNVEAGRRFGIPVAGTMAHAMVQAMGSDESAFRAFADAFPDNALLLVDTFDTAEGIAAACRIGKELAKRGKRLRGVRLDSGNLLALSVLARNELDKAGFSDAIVVASNDLDEHEILRLRAVGAPIGAWGVGTKLVTCFDEPALGGVWKLAEFENNDGKMEPRMKMSRSDPAKSTLPGRKTVIREWLLNTSAPDRMLGDEIVLCSEAGERLLDMRKQDLLERFDPRDTDSPIYETAPSHKSGTEAYAELSDNLWGLAPGERYRVEVSRGVKEMQELFLSQ